MVKPRAAFAFSAAISQLLPESSPLPLKPVTRDFLALVERETGYPTKLVEEPNLPTLARAQTTQQHADAHRLAQAGAPYPRRRQARSTMKLQHGAGRQE